MNDIKNYTEYTIQKKTDPAFFAKKLIFGIGFIIIPLALCLFIAFSSLIKILFPLIPAILISSAALAYYFSRFFDVEYEYCLSGETLTISRIYGKKSRKEWGVFDIRQAETIAPYNKDGCEHYKELADSFEAMYIYTAVSSMSENNVFFMLFPPESSCGKTIVFFEPNEKFLQIAKLYCRSAIVKETVL